MSDRTRGGSHDEPPQLHIWDDEGRQASVGTVAEDGAEWELVVLLEPVAGDLFRGRLSFRNGEERHDTAPVLVEESAEAVVRRAADLPAALLRQLLVSARD